MPENETPKSSGAKIKTLLGTAGGLLSGAAVMWFSPLLDKVIKPAKPIANYGVMQTQGLTVTFENRSMNGGTARWDFGDGSPLVFSRGDDKQVVHSYPKPAVYATKLTVANVLGEENERTVTVEVGDVKSKTASAKPTIMDLHIRKPGKKDQPIYAPATLQFEAQADNAQVLVWDFGDGKDGLLLGDNQMSHTFATPGTYTITLCAFNDKKEKTSTDATIDVMEPPSGVLNIRMKVADQGTQVETRRRETVASQAITLTGKDDPLTAEQTFSASPGFVITEAESKGRSNENLKETKFQIAPDGKTMKVVAGIEKVAAGTPTVLNEQIAIVEQRKEKVSRDPSPVANTLAAPGTATVLLPPVPEDWVDVQRKYTVELRQDNKVLSQWTDLPQNAPVTIGDRTYKLIATPKGEQIQFSLATSMAAR